MKNRHHRTTRPSDANMTGAIHSHIPFSQLMRRIASKVEGEKRAAVNPNAKIWGANNGHGKPKCLLTDEQVREIRTSYEVNSATCEEILEKWGEFFGWNRTYLHNLLEYRTRSLIFPALKNPLKMRGK